MISPARQPVPSDATVFEYFKRIGEATDIPIILQDHPASSDTHISADLMLRIVREVPGIAGMKAEAPPTPPTVRALLDGMTRQGRTVPVMTGLGALYALFDLEAGSAGFHTGFAFPEILQAMMARHRAGDIEGLQRLYDTYLPLIVYEQQPGMALRKEILRRRGLIAGGRVRHPGGGLNAFMAEQMTRLRDRLFPG
jgi:4-hydroxy-tetrahydrodipicolinate synthase